MVQATSAVEPIGQDQGGSDAGAELDEKGLLDRFPWRFWAELIHYSCVYFLFHQPKLCVWQLFVCSG